MGFIFKKVYINCIVRLSWFMGKFKTSCFHNLRLNGIDETLNNLTKHLITFHNSPWEIPFSLSFYTMYMTRPLKSRRIFYSFRGIFHHAHIVCSFEVSMMCSVPLFFLLVYFNYKSYSCISVKRICPYCALYLT